MIFKSNAGNAKYICDLSLVNSISLSQVLGKPLDLALNIAKVSVSAMILYPRHIKKWRFDIHIFS